MTSRDYRKVGGLILLILFMLACVSPLSGAPTPTPLPEAKMWGTLNAAIAGTAAAAQTQTVTARPPTLTPTITRTPSRTPTQLTPSPTVFSLFTATFDIHVEATNASLNATITPINPTSAADSGGGGGRHGHRSVIPTSTPEPWACHVRYSPDLKVRPGERFYAGWEVINVGTKAWGGNDVDFVYRGGFVHEGRKRQDLHSTVAPGSMLPIGSIYIAPHRLGSYHAFYVLQVGRNAFCPMWMKFEVVK